MLLTVLELRGDPRALVAVLTATIVAAGAGAGAAVAVAYGPDSC